MTTYAKKIKEKKFAWGGRAFASVFPARGSVSLVGSILSGNRSTKDDELLSVHAQMLLEGTEQLSKKDIQIELDAMGASLSFSANNDRLVFFARARTAHLEGLLALIAEVLERPTFPESELAILKKREEANLSMQAQETRAQAGIALSRLIFPKDHPNYQQTTRESLSELKKISASRLREYHSHILNRNTLVFSAAGDVVPAHIFALAEKYFKILPGKKIQPSKIPRTQPARRKSKIVTLKEKASIDYMLGIATRIDKTHADYPALMVGLQVLGLPGFTGRLMQIVREKEGLTYGVYSYMQGFDVGTDGCVTAWGTFSPKLIAKGKASMLREMKRLVEEGATDEEARKHAKLFAARASVGMSSSGAFARAAHAIGVDGRPLTHLDTFPQRVLTLTTKEVNKALKKYIKLDKLSESAAGPIEKI